MRSEAVTHTPPDPGKDIEGRVLRIFTAGHVFEDLAMCWLRQAGFDLHTQPNTAVNGGKLPDDLRKLNSTSGGMLTTS